MKILSYVESNKRIALYFFLYLCLISNSFAQNAGGSVADFIVEKSESDKDFPIVRQDKKQAVLRYDQNDFKGVIRAIVDLQNDIDSVTGNKPELRVSDVTADYEIVIGTLGKSKLIDNLVSSKLLDTKDLKGKWESFVIATILNPNPKTKKCLVIAGSDKRGTIYGIYELSRQLGVSPWYWWADIPVLKRSVAYVLAGRYSSGEPKVKYRGIFINDENPCMQRWARAKFGGMNSKMYTRMFELLLRLKANYLWPGMWGSITDYNPEVPIFRNDKGEYEGNSFNEDDPDNPRLADEYGIVMGTSHHEPMQRSQQEWIRNKQNYGNGEWNYMTNKEGVQKFFREGIENTKNYESIITMGMRGDDDKPMVDAGSAEANFRILEGIMKDQRKIISEVTGKSAAKTPQVWTLYSEVLEYYDKGMKVPEDMIILLCNDNWGNVRRLPELNEKHHPAGYGMYYHTAYYGAPRASKWLNMSQIPKMWEQLQLTYDYGVDKIWILNVGDLKPCEYTMDFFLNMAWNPKAFNQNNLNEYSRKFCGQQFGVSQANEAAEILNTYCKYAARVTAEMLDDKTYNLQSGEFKAVKDEFLALETRALRQYLTLPYSYKDAYYELVLFPVQAMANLYDLYYSVAMNQNLAFNKDSKANNWASHAEYCFKRDSLLCANYNHNIAGGKWNHMMDQVHIGYTKWHPPIRNIMPKVVRVNENEAKSGKYVFTQKHNVVVMEAEHFFECKNAENASWEIVPNMGRTLSGLGLFPYNKSVDGASISYKMKLDPKITTTKVHLILNSTMPFKKGGHKIALRFDGSQENTININADLVWGNHYTKMYPTGAARIIEKELSMQLPANINGTYTLTLRPLDPGILIYKVIVDCGGYVRTHLKMQESEYSR